MHKYKHQSTASVRDYFIWLLYSMTLAVILVLCMPSNHYTSNTYRLGEPWMGAPVIAKDSFRVWKSDERLAAERDSMLRYFYEPYFSVDSAVCEQQVQSFLQEFNLQPADVPKVYETKIVERLTEVYRRGVMDPEDYEEMTKHEVSLVRLYVDNKAISRKLSRVFTPKTAYEFLMSDADTSLFNKHYLQLLNMNRFLAVNLTFDKPKSEQHRRELAESVVAFIGKVKEGEKIVDRGKIVDEYTFNALRSMERHILEQQRGHGHTILHTAGRFVYALLVSLFMVIFFRRYRADYLRDFRTMLLVAILYLIFPVATYALVHHNLMSVFLIPYCILPICLRIFLDSRTAFTVHILSLLMSAIVLAYPMEFMALQSLAGLAAIYSLRKFDQRGDLLRTIGVVVFISLLTCLIFDLKDGVITDLDSFPIWDYLYLVLAGFLCMVSYLLLFAIEKTFGFTSNVTLVELSNTNNPLLRRLSEEAPGTFQHSMQVGNLAAEVANSIGANSQLVRTAAFYHDIGKLENPTLFTENQTGVNPHDKLSFEESAKLIISHVESGVRLAEKAKMPEVIVNFIRTHHGTSLTKYFYISYKNQNPDAEVDERLFQYAGPNPSTQEQAILMMADAVEAASRSLKEYTEESVGKLVDNIIDGQVAGGFFANCPITFLDIQMAKQVFKAKLKTIYHARISYPEQKRKN